MTKRIPVSRRQALLSSAPETPVRVFTFQSAAAWERAKEVGYLTGDREFVDEDWGGAYDWMRQQMAERIPDFSWDYPVWAWMKRPNLREEFYAPQPPLLVTALVPRRRILASDYDGWHSVLNFWPVCFTDEQEDEVESVPAEDWPAAVRGTWPRIFDIHLPLSPPEDAARGAPKVVQLCIDRVHFHEVTTVREVVGRRGRFRP